MAVAFSESENSVPAPRPSPSNHSYSLRARAGARERARVLEIGQLSPQEILDLQYSPIREIPSRPSCSI